MQQSKTLVIGHREGNVADEFYLEFGLIDGFHMPGRDEVDCLDPDTIDAYIVKHGPFDRMLYAAAINELTWIKDITYADLQAHYAINVFGFVQMVSSHINYFPQEHARVVALVSDAARTPMRGSLLYGSSKTALTGVIRNMARELAPQITVVGVSPTVIDNTPMTDYIDETVPLFRGWDPQKARAYETSNIPMGRRVTKQEVAATILFAMTGPATLTGSIIEITGGK